MNAFSPLLLAIGAVLLVAQDKLFSQGFDPTETAASSGTITTMGSEMLRLHSKGGRGVMTFITNVVTDCVDKAGKPHDLRELEAGSPVTVLYWRAGEHLVAAKVVLNEGTDARMAAVTPLPDHAASSASHPLHAFREEAAASEKKPAAPSATPAASRLQTADHRITSGRASEKSVIVLERDASDTPVQHVERQTRNVVDEQGRPVPGGHVRAGASVTIYYRKIGDTLIASKVVVHSPKAVPVGQAVSWRDGRVTSGGGGSAGQKRLEWGRDLKIVESAGESSKKNGELIHGVEGKSQPQRDEKNGGETETVKRAGESG